MSDLKYFAFGLSRLLSVKVVSFIFLFILSVWSIGTALDLAEEEGI